MSKNVDDRKMRTILCLRLKTTDGCNYNILVAVFPRFFPVFCTVYYPSHILYFITHFFFFFVNLLVVDEKLLREPLHALCRTYFWGAEGPNNYTMEHNYSYYTLQLRIPCIYNGLLTSLEKENE